MVKMLYTFHRSRVGQNTLSDPESNNTNTSDGNVKATTTSEKQQINVPQTKQATNMHYTNEGTYVPQTTQATNVQQTNRKDNHLYVLTIQQIQRKGLKKLLSLPQNNEVMKVTVTQQ